MVAISFGFREKFAWVGTNRLIKENGWIPEIELSNPNLSSWIGGSILWGMSVLTPIPQKWDSLFRKMLLFHSLVCTFHPERGRKVNYYFSVEKCGQSRNSSFAQNLPVVTQNIGPYWIPSWDNPWPRIHPIYLMLCILTLMLMHFCCLQTLEMLEKKEHLLQKKISVEIERAKKFTQSKNKKGGS